MAASNSMLEMWNRISDTPPPVPPAPEPRLEEDLVPPVPGVPDGMTVAVYLGEEGPPGQVRDEAEVRARLSAWSNEPEPDPAVVQAVMENLPAVMARGRKVLQSAPDLGAWTQGSAPHGADTTVENLELFHEHPEWFTPQPDAEADLKTQRVEPDPVGDASDAISERYHARYSNPADAAVRGGPIAPQARVAGIANPRPQLLADWMLRSGLHPDLADMYRNTPLQFIQPLSGAYLGGVGGHAGSRAGISLDGFLTAQKEEDALRVAQHEGVHQYGATAGGFQRGYSFTPPGFIEAARGAVANGDAGFATLLRKPGAYAHQPIPGHEYTSPFDLGMTIDELPPAVRPYYMGSDGRSLLPENPLAWLLRQRGLQHGPFDKLSYLRGG